MGGLRQQNDRLWSIVLAGGNGERLRPAVDQWFGHDYPKQYCTFVGTRSMFQHTIDRADRMVAPERRMTVIAQAHQHLAWEQLKDRSLGTMISQPLNRDTAAGIFLPLTYVRAQQVKATVIIFPSDHFVYPEEPFSQVVQQAVRAAEWLTDRVVLLGVQPDNMKSDYGWIQTSAELGRAFGHPVRAVDSFVEKPDPAQWMKRNHPHMWWNTLILATKVETLWNLGWQFLPEIMPLFESVGEAIGTKYEKTVLESIYRLMPVRNFSSHLLAPATKHLAVLELVDVFWSDWGSADRILDDIRRFGLQPAFSLKQEARVRHSRQLQLENAVQT